MAVSTETARGLIGDLHMLGRVMRTGLAGSRDPALHQGVLGVLVALEARGACRQTDLALDLCLSPSALSRHVTELVGDGWVDRKSDPDDGRATQVSLTAAGRALVQRSRNARAGELQVALADWTEADAESARLALGKLKQSLADHVRRAALAVPTSNSNESQEMYV